MLTSAQSLIRSTRTRRLLGTGLLLGALALAEPAVAVTCPHADTAARGYTLWLSNGDGYRIDTIANGVTYVRHLDNRGNTLGSQELYGGLFTLAVVGNKGRASFNYDVDLAAFFPIRENSVLEVRGTMVDETGKASPVIRTSRVLGRQTKWVDLCSYRVRYIESVITWPTLGLQFRQEKLWSDEINMVLYLRTTVLQNGLQTRVNVYDAVEIEW